MLFQQVYGQAQFGNNTLVKLLHIRLNITYGILK